MNHGHRKDASAGRARHVRPPLPGLPKGSRPRVTVVVTCFNYGRYLPMSVGSALDQPGVATDVVIVDDASDDDSASVAVSLAAADSRVGVLTRRANGGPVAAFNDGLAKAQGEYLVRLDADDLLTPGSLARSLALLEANPWVGMAYGRPLHFDGDSELPAACDLVRGWTIWPGRTWLARRCRRGDNCITSPEVVMRTELVRQHGGLRAELPHTHDMELWLRLAALADVGHVDGPDQAWHREHPASLSVRDFASQVSDLRERHHAFQVLFSEMGSRIDRAGQLAAVARHALTLEALDRACRAYDRGHVHEVPVDELAAFALELEPAATRLPQWKALELRRRIGPRLTPVLPPFVARAATRRLADEWGRRQWLRNGV